MSTGFRNIAVFQHDNFVSMFYRTKTVGDN